MCPPTQHKSAHRTKQKMGLIVLNAHQQHCSKWQCPWQLTISFLLWHIVWAGTVYRSLWWKCLQRQKKQPLNKGFWVRSHNGKAKKQLTLTYSGSLRCSTRMQVLSSHTGFRFLCIILLLKTSFLPILNFTYGSLVPVEEIHMVCISHSFLRKYDSRSLKHQKELKGKR